MDELLKDELLSVCKREVMQIRVGRSPGQVAGAIGYISGLYAHTIGAYPPMAD